MSEKQSQLISLVVLGLATMLSPLDTTVNIAMPSIMADFDLAVADIKWIPVAMILPGVCFTIVFGYLGDLIGHRKIFIIGCVASALSFALCAMSTTFGYFLLARVIQGIALAMVMVPVIALLTSQYPESEKRRLLGLFVMFAGAGFALGLLVAGFLVELWSWQGTFWFRTGLAMIVLAGSFRVTRETPANRTERFDVIGAILLSVVATLLVGLSVSMASKNLVYMAGVAFATLLAIRVFYRYESQHANPVIQVGYFENAQFSLLQVAALVINACCFSITLLVPIYPIDHLLIGAVEAGVIVAISPAGVVLSGIFVSRMNTGLISRRLALLGMGVSTAGLLLTGICVDHNLILVLPVGLALVGIGLGGFKAGCVDITTGFMSVSERGVAGSLHSVIERTGFVMGAGLTAAVYELGSGTHPISGYVVTYLALGSLLLVATVLFRLANPD